MKDENDNSTRDYIEVVSDNGKAKSEREKIYKEADMNHLLKDEKDGFDDE